MSPTNHPGEPGDRAAGNEPADGGSYTEQYNRGAPAPDLDAGAPELRAQDMRRLNRRAIGFLVAIVLLLLVLAFLLLKTATSPKQAAQPRAETLVVPQLPQLPPSSRRQSAAQAPVPAAPTSVAAMPVPPLPVLPADTPRKPELPQGPSLLERREMATQGNGEPSSAAGGQIGAPAPASGSLGGKYGKPTSATQVVNPDTLLMQGTIIRCVLQTRIISDIPGFSSCIVTDPVYSFDGKHMLLPKGSKVLGQYDSGPVGSRIAVVWNRIVTPTGINVNMASPGIDNLGGSGLPGHLDSHWPSRISSALLISLMSDAFLYEGEKHGPTTTTIGSGGFAVQSPFQSNTAQTLQDLSRQAVQQSANRPATLTINQGSIISIYVARDVDFSGVVSRL